MIHFKPLFVTLLLFIVPIGQLRGLEKEELKTAILLKGSIMNLQSGRISQFSALSTPKDLNELKRSVRKAGSLLYSEQNRDGSVFIVGNNVQVLNPTKQATLNDIKKMDPGDYFSGRLKKYGKNYFFVETSKEMYLICFNWHSTGAASVSWLEISGTEENWSLAVDAFKSQEDRVLGRNLKTIQSGHTKIHLVMEKKGAAFSFRTLELVKLPELPKDADDMRNLLFPYLLANADIFQHLEGFVMTSSGKAGEIPPMVLETILNKGIGTYLKSSRKPQQFAVESGKLIGLKCLDGNYAVIRIRMSQKDELSFDWLYQPNGSDKFRLSNELKQQWIPPRKLVSWDDLKNGLVGQSSRMLSIDDKKALLSQAVASGVDIDAKENGKSSLLHMASQQHLLDIANLLILNGADVNLSGPFNVTPLHYAASGKTHGNVELCKLLLKNGAKLNATTKFGDTPLMGALKLGDKNKDVIELLRGNMKNGLTVHEAVLSRDTEALKMALKQDPKSVERKNNREETPLTAAVRLGDVNICNILISNGAAPYQSSDAGRPSAMELAAELGKVEIMKLFIQQKEVDKDTLARCLSAASFRNHLESVKLLLDLKVDIYASPTPGITIFDEIMLYSDEKLIDLIEKYGHQRNLIPAIRFGDYELAVKLIKKDRATINKPFGHNRITPIFFALSSKDLKMIRLLLDNGAQLEMRDASGRTPIFIAVELEDLKILNLLLEQKVKINLTDNMGNSPLDTGVELLNKRVVELLLKYGADPNLGYKGADPENSILASLKYEEWDSDQEKKVKKDINALLMKFGAK